MLRSSSARGSCLPAALAVLTVLTGWGCGPGEDEIVQVVETEHFEVVVHEGAPQLCRGEYRAIDELVTASRAAVDRGGPAEPTTLHLWPKTSPSVPCEPWAGGCFLWPANEVHVREPGSLHHEVVHAAITPGLPAFYSEGFAEAFSTTIAPSGELGFDPRPLLDAPNTDFEYWRAAVFVNFLIEEFGAEASFRAARDALELGSEAALAKWTGHSLDEIAAEFAAAPVHCGTQLTTCARPTQPVGEAWSFDATLPCASERALGVDGGEYAVFTLDVEGGSYALEVEGGRISLERCAPCASRSSWLLGDPNRVVNELVALEPGLHALILEPASSGLPMRVELAREG